jgi:hypothetical protein
MRDKASSRAAQKNARPGAVAAPAEPFAVMI